MVWFVACIMLYLPKPADGSPHQHAQQYVKRVPVHWQNVTQNTLRLSAHSWKVTANDECCSVGAFFMDCITWQQLLLASFIWLLWLQTFPQLLCACFLHRPFVAKAGYPWLAGLCMLERFQLLSIMEVHNFYRNILWLCWLSFIPDTHRTYLVPYNFSACPSTAIHNLLHTWTVHLSPFSLKC